MPPKDNQIGHSGPQLTDHTQALLSLLAVDACPRLGSVTAGKIAQYYDIAHHEIPQLSLRALHQIGLTETQIKVLKTQPTTTFNLIQTFLCKSPHTQLVLHHEQRYPEWLRHSHSPPLFLFIEGDATVLSRPQIAIVGSRFASDYGKQHARKISYELAQNGWVITSGLAQGIDAQAHRGALDCGTPTIAVLGHGLKYTYPQFHQDLRREIVDGGGCVISEFLPYKPAHPSHFPKRNRIISGLSKGVVVIEAKAKSGSLITAKYALQDNRDVFALPGLANCEHQQGCHSLIKDGANLVENAQDICAYYPNLEKIRHRPNIDTNDNLKQSLAKCDLLDSVEDRVTSLEMIATRCPSLSLPDILSKLLEYELLGLVAAVPGGFIKVKR